jgi:hypothetical protein
MKTDKVPLFVSGCLAAAEEEVEFAKKALDAAFTRKNGMLPDTLVVCTSQVATGVGCNKVSKIGDLTYIQTYWYDPNTGSPNGGFLRPGEGQFICPHCGHKNRLYENPEIEKLKAYFMEVVDDYGR